MLDTRASSGGRLISLNVSCEKVFFFGKTFFGRFGVDAEPGMVRGGGWVEQVSDMVLCMFMYVYICVCPMRFLQREGKVSGFSFAWILFNLNFGIKTVRGGERSGWVEQESDIALRMCVCVCDALFKREEKVSK